MWHGAKASVDCKIMCFYLPQFHENEDNNRWWGKGYTEWNAVKESRPVLKGQKQPRHPLHGNYYDMGDETATAWKWQAGLAEKYGVYGFSIYHYWFAGKKLLHKPVEILLRHPEIELRYNLCWDNNEWRRTWYRNKNENEILMPQDYGDEEVWTRHFYDLLPYFQDERYIKLDNKPVFQIYQAIKIDCLPEMKKCWDKLAKRQGFDGIYVIAGNTATVRDEDIRGADAYYNFEPNRTTNQRYYSSEIGYWLEIKKIIDRFCKKRNWKYSGLHKRRAKTWYRLIIGERYRQIKPVYEGIFVGFDDTPRRRDDCTVYRGVTPKRFEKALKRLALKALRNGRQFIYINAWNEWGETAYLEPDEEYGYSFLESVGRTVAYLQKRTGDR